MGLLNKYPIAFDPYSVLVKQQQLPQEGENNEQHVQLHEPQLLFQEG